MSISGVSQVNMAYYPYLPMGVTNFGGDIQVFSLDNSIEPLQMSFNPLAMNCFQNPYAMNPFSQCPIPTQLPTTEQLNEWVFKPIETNLAKSNMGSVAGTINATKAKLNSMLQIDGISEEDKNKVNALLERLDEQEKKLSDLQKEQADGLENSEVFDRTKEIEKAMREIAAETAQLKGSIKPTSTEKKEDKADGDTATDGTNSKASDATQQNEAGKAEGNDANDGFFVKPELADQRAELETQVDAQKGGITTARDIAQKFYDACEGTGTDNDTFEKVCKQINKDNVLDLMFAYNQYQSQMNGESFMKTFMWDASHSQKKEYGKRIADALKEKAIELGVYEKCEDDFTKIYRELGDWFISNDIYENYDNIIEKLGEATGKTEYAKPKSKV